MSLAFWATWPHAFVFLFTLLWTGCRPFELTARRWRDFDPRTKKLEVTTSRTEGEEGDTKTDKSARAIDLLEPVVEYLNMIKPLRARPDDHIFLGTRGAPLDHENFGRYFQGGLTALKIRHRDFYHIRHTYISVMLTHGENVKKIAEQVGTSPEMIATSYGKYIGNSEAFGQRALAASKATKTVTQAVAKPPEKLKTL